MKVEGIQKTQINAIHKNMQGQFKNPGKAEDLQKHIEGEGFNKEQNFSQLQLIKAVDKANESFKPFERRFEITIHEETSQIMVKVINSATDELIREVPPERVLDMVAYMMEVAGLLVDTRI